MSPLVGGRVLGRLRQHHTCLCEANERCNGQNGQAQKAIPHTLACSSTSRGAIRSRRLPAEGASRHLTFAQKAVAVSGSAATVFGANWTNGDRWDRTMGGSIQIAAK